jgi:nicotinamide-nucleotide amidase
MEAGVSKPNLKAAILATGSELTLGRSTDTNSAYLSTVLSSLGVEVIRHVTVGDNMEVLVDLFDECFREYNVVLCTGGLGPTEDDLTRLAAAKARGQGLTFRPELAEYIRAFIKNRGYIMPPNNYRQAWLPSGALPVPNKLGTAPAFAFDEADKLMVFMPGVPVEMKGIINDWVKPRVLEKFAGRVGVIETLVLKSAGQGESTVDQILGDLLRVGPNPYMGLLSGLNETRILITARGRDHEETSRLIEPLAKEVEKRLGPNYLGRGPSASLASAAANLLQKHGLTLGLVDNLTGGRLSAMLTDHIPQGSRAPFLTVPEGQWGAPDPQWGGDLWLIMGGRSSAPDLLDPDAEIVINMEMRVLRRSGSNFTLVAQNDHSFTAPRAGALTRGSTYAALLLWNYLKDLK